MEAQRKRERPGDWTKYERDGSYQQRNENVISGIGDYFVLKISPFSTVFRDLPTFYQLFQRNASSELNIVECDMGFTKAIFSAIFLLLMHGIKCIDLRMY